MSKYSIKKVAIGYSIFNDKDGQIAWLGNEQDAKRYIANKRAEEIPGPNDKPEPIDWEARIWGLAKEYLERVDRDMVMINIGHAAAVKAARAFVAEYRKQMGL